MKRSICSTTKAWFKSCLVPHRPCCIRSESKTCCLFFLALAGAFLGVLSRLSLLRRELPGVCLLSITSCGSLWYSCNTPASQVRADVCLGCRLVRNQCFRS